MRLTTIGELTEPIQTWNPARSPGHEFSYIDLGAVDNRSKSITSTTRLAGSQVPSRARQLVTGGDVLVSTVRPNLNAVARVPPVLDGATASTGFTVLRPGRGLDGAYLFHWIRSSEFIADMVSKATGASYPAVSDRIVKESLIPAPHVDEQRRIAEILDQADALRTKRHHIIAHLDELTQSIFSKMFDGQTWPVVPVVDLARMPDDVRCGPFGTQLKQSEFRTTGVPLLGIKNVNANFELPPFEFVEQATADRLAIYSLVPGDIVMTRKGTIGNCAVYPNNAPPGIMHSDLLRLRVDASRTDGVYLEHQLQLSRRVSRQIEAMSPGAVMPGINVTKLKQVEVDAPPLELQREFAARTRTIGRQRSTIRQAGAVQEELFVSLQARAFRGGL